MGPGVPREAQRLVCVCANEFGGAKDCSEYRQAAGAIETLAPGGAMRQELFLVAIPDKSRGRPSGPRRAFPTQKLR
jgi:hypothetical protein